MLRFLGGASGCGTFRRSASCFFTACLLLSVPAASTAWTQEVLIAPDEEWAYFPGTEAPPADWIEPDFDDSGWLTGPAGFGYGDGDDATLLSDMQNSYVTVFIRKVFDIENIDDLALLQIGVQYDDGFVAYLNGVEVARSSTMGAAGGPANFDTTASDHEVNATPQWFTVGGEGMDALDERENVLAISGHNANLTSSDFSLIPQARSFSSVCPTTVTCTERSSGGVRLTWRNAINPPPYEAVEIYRNGDLIGMASRPTATSFTDAEAPCQENLYEVVAIIDGEPCEGEGRVSCSLTPEDCGGSTFRRGDSDDDGNVLLTDAVVILTWLFRQGAAPVCLDAADADDNGQNNLTDAVFVLQHLFQAGAAPPDPGTTQCGSDPTDDPLSDCAATSC